MAVVVVVVAEKKVPKAVAADEAAKKMAAVCRLENLNREGSPMGCLFYGTLT